VLKVLKREFVSSQFVKFLLVGGFAALINFSSRIVINQWLGYATSVVLADYFFPSVGFAYHPKEIAHAIGIMIPALTSFIGHKYLTFR